MKTASLFISALLVTLAFGLSGCASSNMAASEFEAQIPEAAFEVHLYSERTPDDFLGFIRRNLEMQGFAIIRYSAVDQNLATAATQVGRQLTLTVFVSVSEDYDVGKTRAVISGLQGRENAIVGAARWNLSGDDQAFAFSKLAQTANRIEHERLVYAVAER